MILQTDCNGPSVGCKLKGIRQQIGQYLFHLIRIHPQHYGRDIMLKRVLYLFALCHIIKIGTDIFDKGNQIYFRHPHIHLVTFYLTEVEQLADNTFQAVGILLYDMYVVGKRRIGRQFFR